MINKGYGFWPELDPMMPRNPLWPEMYDPKNPNQKELDLVEPLTEQLKLPLDYDGCDTMTNRIVATTGTSALPISNGGTNATAHLEVESDKFIMKYKKKPNLFRRKLLKVLGIEWKVE